MEFLFLFRGATLFEGVRPNRESAERFPRCNCKKKLQQYLKHFKNFKNMNAYLNNLSMCSKSTKPSSTLTKCADEVPQSQE